MRCKIISHGCLAIECDFNWIKRLLDDVNSPFGEQELLEEKSGGAIGMDMDS